MRSFFKLILLGIFGILFVSCGNKKEGESKNNSTAKLVRIAHGTSESYHLHRAWLKFKSSLEETGKFKVEIYPSSQFGNDTEMIESVKTGDLTIACPPSPFLTDEVPGIALIELPYVFPSKETALKTLEGEWGQKQLDLLGKSGLYGMGYLESGLRHLTNSKKLVRTPEDLKGLKLRTMQVPSHVFYWNSMGSSAEGSPFAELYTNLSTKVFDGQENPTAHIYSQKLFEVQPYITMTGHVYTTYLPVMSLDFWKSLNEEEQSLIKNAFDDSVKFQKELIAKEEKSQIEEMLSNKEYKVEILELTPGEKEAFIKSAKPTLEKYRKDLGEEIFDEFTTAINKASE